MAPVPLHPDYHVSPPLRVSAALGADLCLGRVLWGFCMLGMGFVHNWSGLMAGRFFLGVAEAGLFPGINYYLSCWFVTSWLRKAGSLANTKRQV